MIYLPENLEAPPSRLLLHVIVDVFLVHPRLGKTKRSKFPFSLPSFFIKLSSVVSFSNYVSRHMSCSVFHSSLGSKFSLSVSIYYFTLFTYVVLFIHFFRVHRLFPFM